MDVAFIPRTKNLPNGGCLFLGVLCWGHNFFPLPLELSKFLLLLVYVLLCRSRVCYVCYVCVRLQAPTCWRRDIEMLEEVWVSGHEMGSGAGRVEIKKQT